MARSLPFTLLARHQNRSGRHPPSTLNLPSSTTQTLLLHVFGRKKAYSSHARPLNFRWDQALRSDWCIERLRVPAARKAYLRYELFRLGVHASSLFPDVDGLAARIRWQHSISSPSKDTVVAAPPIAD